MRYRDRRDAGQRLGRELADLAGTDVLVVGLPRGGVPVALEVARAIGAPLDVVLVRKLGCPWHRELGVGALGEDGVRVLNRRLMRELGIGEAQLAPVVRDEEEELAARHERYRGQRSPLQVADRTVVVVDDGLATGFTARAAIEVLRRRGAARIVLAVPVAPPEAVAELAQVADDVVCPHQPRAFGAIGQFYVDFGQTTDEEVARLLADAGRDQPGLEERGDDGGTPASGPGRAR